MPPMSRPPDKDHWTPGVVEHSDHPPEGWLAALAWYTQRKPVFTGGNQVSLLQGGRALFPALCERIDQAQRSVWMALYIVSPLGQSSAVLQSLMRAARRGVEVSMVVPASFSTTMSMKSPTFAVASV